jgi:hypothetical protein
MGLTKRWSERPPALRLPFVWLTPFRFERHSLSVAVAQLVLVRCLKRNHRNMCLLFKSNAVRLFTAVGLPFVIASHAIAQSPTPFVPKEFKVPEKLETQEFRLRMLTVNDVVKDYDAVMTSVEHLKSIWPDGSWPEGLTFEQDLIDLAGTRRNFRGAHPSPTPW